MLANWRVWERVTGKIWKSCNVKGDRDFQSLHLVFEKKSKWLLEEEICDKSIFRHHWSMLGSQWLYGFSFGFYIWALSECWAVFKLLLEICGHSWMLKAADLMKLWLKCCGSCWTGQIIIVEQWQKQCAEVSDRFWQVHLGNVNASGVCGRHSVIKRVAIKQSLVSENCEEYFSPVLWSILCSLDALWNVEVMCRD